MKMRIEHLRRSYYQISQKPQTVYPCLHGLSVMKYSQETYNIAKTLSAQGCKPGENHIAKSLKRVNPGYQTAQAHRIINPMLYIVYYYGHKIHID